MLLLDTFEKIKIVALHPDSKLDLLSLANEVLQQIKDEIDASNYETLHIIRYILDKRLNNEKLSVVINDVLTQHPELRDDIEQSLKYNEDDLLDIQQSLQLFIADKRTEDIINDLISKISEMQLEQFPSVTQKINSYKQLIEIAYNKLNEVEAEPVEENEFLIDDSIDLLPLLKDEEHMVCYCGLESLDRALDGFQSGRIYIFSSGTGQGKSTWLSNLAYYIAHNYKSSDYKHLFETEYAQYKPLIIFITNENSIDETRARLLSIIEDKPVETIKTFDKQKQAEILYKFQRDTGVSVLIKYVPPRAFTAFDILSLSNKFEKKGYKPISIIVDYLDRLNSTQRAKEERHLLGFVTDELKHISIKLKVPVITASQLNREGHKSDVKDITQMSESWQKVQNADAVLLFSKLDAFDHTEFHVTIGKLRYKAVDGQPLKFVMKNSLKIKESLSDDKTTVREQPLNNVSQYIGGQPTWITEAF